MKKKVLCFAAAIMMIFSSFTVNAAANTPAVFVTSGSIGAPVSITSTTAEQMVYAVNDKSFAKMVFELSKNPGYYLLNGSLSGNELYATINKIDGSVFWDEIINVEESRIDATGAFNDPANYDRVIALETVYNYTAFPYVNFDYSRPVKGAEMVTILSGAYAEIVANDVNYTSVPAYMKDGYFYSKLDDATADKNVVSNPTQLGHVYKWKNSITFNGITTRTSADTKNLFYMCYNRMTEIKNQAINTIEGQQAPAIMNFLNANTELNLKDIKVKSVGYFDIYGSLGNKASVLNFTANEIQNMKSGNKVIVMHYNTSEKKWEHIADAGLFTAFDGTKYVSGTFTSLSPVVVFEVESMTSEAPEAEIVDTPVKGGDTSLAPKTGMKFLGLF